MIRESERERKEFARKTEEWRVEFEREREKTNRIIASLGSRIGEIVEHMIQGNIVNKFQALGYEITQYSRNTIFENRELDIRGEIDFFLNDGNTDILIEVKTSLEIPDIHEHIERMEKYRRYFDAKDDKRPRRFVGAVAGAVVKDNAKQFAHKNGMYVITQSGEAVEILPLPKDFKAKEW
jgi:predicted AAA+ superfamily ATPase